MAHPKKSPTRLRQEKRESLLRQGKPVPPKYQLRPEEIARREEEGAPPALTPTQEFIVKFFQSPVPFPEEEARRLTMRLSRTHNSRLARALRETIQGGQESVHQAR